MKLAIDHIHINFIGLKFGTSTSKCKLNVGGIQVQIISIAGCLILS